MSKNEYWAKFETLLEVFGRAFKKSEKHPNIPMVFLILREKVQKNKFQLKKLKKTNCHYFSFSDQNSEKRPSKGHAASKKSVLDLHFFIAIGHRFLKLIHLV